MRMEIPTVTNRDTDLKLSGSDNLSEQQDFTFQIAALTLSTRFYTGCTLET